MDSGTGNFVKALDREEALQKLREKRPDMSEKDLVMMIGDIDTIKKVSKRVKLGVKEEQRKKKKRKAAKNSRKGNR